MGDIVGVFGAPSVPETAVQNPTWHIWRQRGFVFVGFILFVCFI